jgi:transposase
MKNLFIGIDFSKKKIDASVMERSDTKKMCHQEFANSKEGCAELLKWVKGQTLLPSSEWLFCGEHTGLYSMLLSEFLIKKKMFMWLENPLQIKLCSGIKREKNDKIDSRDIALYACRYQDRAKAYQLPEKTLQSLSLLLSFRERLLGNKHTLLVSSREVRKVLQRDTTARYIYEQSARDIARISKEVSDIENRI